MLKINSFILQAHVYLVASLIPLLVNLFPLKKVLRLLTPSRRFQPYRDAGSEEIAAIIRRRLRDPANMRRRSCLREGLMMFHFLCLAGKPTKLQIGVYAPRADQKRTRAHCWVMLNGECISSPPREPVAVVLTHIQKR
ncbi:MAG: lasso peptide biosynthesis B2 protein [Phycisphaerae bacterium]|nr:lasso peptide biosynthesis B2 protein [Phycisphaerae bacterium]